LIEIQAISALHQVAKQEIESEELIVLFL